MAAPRRRGGRLRDYQHTLLDAGVPLYWSADVSFDTKGLFVAAHLLGVRGIMSGFDDMTFRAHDGLTEPQRQEIERAAGTALEWPSEDLSRGEAAVWLVQTLGL